MWSTQFFRKHRLLLSVRYAGGKIMFGVNNHFRKVPARRMWGKVAQINGGENGNVTVVLGSNR